MLALDLRTVLVMNAAVSAAIAVIAMLFLQQNRKLFRGLELWCGYFILQTLATVLVSLRGVVADGLSIVVANALMMTGQLVVYQGMRVFIAGQRHLPPPRWPLGDALLVAVAVALFIDLSAFHPSLSGRIAVASAVAAVLWLQCLALVGRREVRALLPWWRVLVAVLAVHLGLNLLRLIVAVWRPEAQEDLLHASPLQAAAMLGQLAAALALVTILVLVINQLLIDRASAERDKFFAAFEHAPFAISATRRDNGEYLEVNQRYCQITGYARDELIGHSVEEFPIWPDKATRAQTFADFDAAGGSLQRVMRFRRRDGETFGALLQARRIEMDGHVVTMACVADLSELEAAQRRLQQREQELTCANEELMRFNRLAVGRELDMVRLKGEVNALAARLGEAERYPIEPELASLRPPAALSGEA